MIPRSLPWAQEHITKLPGGMSSNGSKLMFKDFPCPTSKAAKILPCCIYMWSGLLWKSAHFHLSVWLFFSHSNKHCFNSENCWPPTHRPGRDRQETTPYRRITEAVDTKLHILHIHYSNLFNNIISGLKRKVQVSQIDANCIEFHAILLIW